MADGLYPQLLGSAWSALAPPVRRLNEASGRTHRGEFTVTRGTGFFSRIVAALSGLPPAGERVPIALAVSTERGAEVWRRSFADHVLVTFQRARGELLSERLGLVECIFRLREESGALRFVQEGARLALLGLSIPLPRALAPRIAGFVERASDTSAKVAISISAPVVGLLVDYRGDIEVGGEP
jgi:hypothetical protein